MKKILELFVIFLFLNVLQSCTKNEKNISVLKGESLEEQMILLYNDAYKSLNDGDTLLSAKKFSEAELIYPQSIWASKSNLMAAYAYYMGNYYDDAKFELDNFLKNYPNNKNISYAYFLLGMCYYEEIVDEKKDLKPLLEAKKIFNKIIKEYPNTDFAVDAQFKNELIEDILASKEIYLGKAYQKKGKWIPAINRYIKVVDDYDTTIYVEEALHRLVEIYYKIGLVDESKKYAKLLGYNYQSSKWYKESYRVFNKRYKLEPSINKKERNFIIKKFKSLFD
jgi:outer membrane protein assembly factor BamD